MRGGRRGSLVIAILAVFVLGAGVMAPWAIHKLENGGATWTDPQTGLIWARRDNGQEVSRQQAIDYCRTLDYAGYKDWRLPTIAEAQTLYDPGLSNAGTWGLGGVNPRPVYWHVKGKIVLTGGAQASDLTFDGLREQSYDFSYGRRNEDSPDFRSDHRALCVRR